ncbi:bile acid:sodium symporter family protein [Zunongwangia endophytica]|uniref:Bile acid:sodium symporter family protein n=1 Tax=Zunongwangia endophytica TaxID=1808945 RepID=A0ABV8HAA2_9FLAO|nr:bile acid:sodium symporter family protein [Zunongwangia endophytica]MDN3594838.1 bile acid:sodium symporter family protein [Zunongwangia endophytica]
MKKNYWYALWIGITAIVLTLVVWVLGLVEFIHPLAVLGAIATAIGLGSLQTLKTYQYTAWILAAIVCGMLYPTAFLSWGDFDLRNPWLILVVVQLVMFGMGTQMSIKDFSGLRTMGKGVLIGLICQFTIMPIIGYLLTKVFVFEPEIAAGVILIGSCSSGLASNVMVYLAKANLTLSITLTAMATLVAPFMTPFLMKMLAGTYVEINFLDMCFQIIKIVIVPIGAALIFDGLRKDYGYFRNVVNSISIMSIIWLIAMIFGFWQYLSQYFSTQTMESIELSNFILGAILFGNIYYRLFKIIPNIQSFMPLISMSGIIYFTTVTTAASRDNLLAIGLFLLFASILHNSLGYILGYGLSRLLGMDKDSCRTVALEVGMQNGGMASGLAGVMGKLATLGLAAAVFSPWMNISGSLLANHWRKRKHSAD